ncbi:MAG: 30S ribosomal protein S18 [Candidatus Kerfeldbacteria bacterium CG15_BIG_FIL_POST_REV_8_21_14_020_45_12]|uniref:Small ribosomal subunit protein bS18 n=1 Tax=Candidatus Kerfeldbacteria bacterium CG15_BIG_FIL_POST_REV_8_21_14_020_45_12 TaxID=2014247 RepID=A0A2M7H2J2_9BACT|nr:MAG: 30S ribosomal protein S18 [Candidatus Kerfeldbacteria bacterium CG15_BIG_FIL_POST_REV_8_21_14_020_45_12]PJA93907.1 MAG: 30S ribosomal protein S18 [Candidatus Kerfeldbacteria bacterium CG_4_9_14_3_um_filter_45_8]
MAKRNTKKTQKRRYDYFSLHGVDYIDFKDIETLQKFTSNYEKILGRNRMGSSAKHQRQLAKAIKRARFMALIPYVPNHK